MQLVQRAYQGERDQHRMLALAHVEPQVHLHLTDLPYRLSSWAFDAKDNICLWEDERGRLRAWAVLQSPFWTIDYVYHPQVSDVIHDHLLEWADHQAHLHRASPYGRPMWFVNVFDWQHQQQRDLERHGFVSQADQGDESWTKVLLQHTPNRVLPTRPSPAGWTIRPLRGEEEVDAYVRLHRAAFESESMTSAWRRRTLHHPDYHPDLDLVAVDSAGDLTAFCVCWFSASGSDGRPCGQIEPLGVRADVRGRGLGRALLMAGMQRLYEHGATYIVVETDNYRDAAFSLYTAVGFQIMQNVLVYRKDYGSGSE